MPEADGSLLVAPPLWPLIPRMARKQRRAKPRAKEKVKMAKAKAKERERAKEKEEAGYMIMTGRSSRSSGSSGVFVCPRDGIGRRAQTGI